MAEQPSKTPVKVERKTPEATPQMWRPFEKLRHEVEPLFDDFDRGIWRSPFRRSLFVGEPAWRRELVRGDIPAVDVTESETAYQIAAELPGMDEKNIEVKVANGNLSIMGEKQEEKEEKKKDYYLCERSFGSFGRSFPPPDGVDRDKIEDSF